MNTPSSDSVIKMPKIVRLKPVQYGEVLTTEDIFQKMKDAEEKKIQKKEKEFLIRRFHLRTWLITTKK